MRLAAASIALPLISLAPEAAQDSSPLFQAALLFDTLLSVASVDDTYEKTGLVTDVGGGAHLINLPKFLLPACSDYLNHRVLARLEKLCSLRIAEMTEYWKFLVPTEFENIHSRDWLQQYSHVHTLQMSMEQPFQFHPFWLQVKEDLDDIELQDLFVLSLPVANSVFGQYVRTVLVEFTADYLTRRHIIWNGNAISPQDMLLVLHASHLPPKLAIVTIFGILQNLLPSFTPSNLHAFFHPVELDKLAPDCLGELENGRVGSACEMAESSFVVDGDLVLLGLTRIAHSVDNIIASSLHHIALELWQKDGGVIDKWFSSSSLPIVALLTRLVLHAKIERASLPASCSYGASLSACRADLADLIKKQMTARVRIYCVERYVSIVDLLVCVATELLKSVSPNLPTSLLSVADVVAAETDDTQPLLYRSMRKRKHEDSQIRFGRDASSDEVLRLTLRSEAVLTNPSFSAASIQCEESRSRPSEQDNDQSCVVFWLQKILASAEFLFVRPWQNLAMFRLLGRVLTVYPTVVGADMPSLPLLSAEFLGESLTSSADWAVALRAGSGRVAGGQLKPLISVVYGEMPNAKEFLYCGVRIPQFVTYSGGNSREVRRATGFLLSDSLVYLSRHNSRTPVKYVDEVGVGEGVVADWLSRTSELLFSEELGLFERLSSGDYEVNVSGLKYHDNHNLVWQFMYMAGRILGIAMVQEVSLGISLGPMLAKILAAETQQVVPADLFLLDPQFASSLNDLRSLSTAQEEMEERIEINVELPYSQRLSEFVDNPTGDVEGYIAVRSLFRLQSEFYTALTDGFQSELSFGEEPASAADIRRNILGEQDFNVDEWKSCTVVVQPNGDTTANLFFQGLEKIGNDDRKKVFAFWTSQNALPPGGFPTIRRLRLTCGTFPYVKSATCFDSLFLPIAEDEDSMDAIIASMLSGSALNSFNLK